MIGILFLFLKYLNYEQRNISHLSTFCFKGFRYEYNACALYTSKKVYSDSDENKLAK